MGNWRVAAAFGQYSFSMFRSRKKCSSGRGPSKRLYLREHVTKRTMGVGGRK